MMLRTSVPPVRTGLYTLVGALSESKPSRPPLFGARPIDCISACVATS